MFHNAKNVQIFIVTQNLALFLIRSEGHNKIMADTNVGRLIPWILNSKLNTGQYGIVALWGRIQQESGGGRFSSPKRKFSQERLFSSSPKKDYCHPPSPTKVHLLVLNFVLQWKFEHFESRSVQNGRYEGARCKGHPSALRIDHSRILWHHNIRQFFHFLTTFGGFAALVSAF